MATHPFSKFDGARIILSAAALENPLRPERFGAHVYLVTAADKNVRAAGAEVLDFAPTANALSCAD
jgi:hypothetical protein